MFLGQGELICEGGPRVDSPGAGAAPGRGLGPTRGWDPPLLLGAPPRGLLAPWLILLKNSFSNSSGFSANFSTLHKRKTPNAILLKTASVRVSSKQFNKNQRQNNSKVFGKVDTFATYQLPQA